MRTLWTIISFLAVVHLLALAMFVAWLWQSQRLTTDRIHATREIFAISLPDAKAAAAKADAEAQTLRQKEIDELRNANPALDSASQVNYIALIKQQEDQSRRRLEDERKVLLSQLSQSAEQVSRKQAELDRLQAEWQSANKGDHSRKSDEQFLQTVRQYEQLPPKQGKRMLAELINQNQMDQAVAYLSAMNVRAASKIFKEFKTDAEIALATELLEKLRTYGSEQTPSGADGKSALATGSATAQGPGNANGSGRPSP